MDIIFATHNKDKLKEIEAILAGLPLKFSSLADWPEAPDTIEDGETFEENALKKAREAMLLTGLPALADDSGLCVDALDGGPGLFSARYAGPGCTYEDNYRKLLLELSKIGPVPRDAHFVCVAALVLPDGRGFTKRGRIDGRIAERPRGDNGFGYDPVFTLPDGRTLAELSKVEKDSISHRAKAFSAMRELLSELLETGEKL